MSTELRLPGPFPEPAAGGAEGARILLFSARFGGGHKSTADALGHWLEHHLPDSQVEIMDYFDQFVSPVTTAAASFGYTQSVRLFPRGYGVFYDVTRNLRPNSSAQQWLNSLGLPELATYLQENRWDLFVAVHPTPAGALAMLRRSGRLESPVVTVITDYVVHNQWIHAGIDLYLVGSECVREGLVRRGVPAERIRVTGIPIRTNTALLQQRDVLKEKWNLKPGLPTVMVMTGAQGMMPQPARLFRVVASRPIQGFFLCGRDKALYTRLQQLWAGRYPDFRVLPFVRVVPELMCVSDLLVTKAGGLTTSEALAMELPMIIFHPIPGQEYANRDYLVESGAALTANSARELGAVLDALCREPGRLEEMRAAIRRIRRPNAAEDAGQEILRLLQERWRWIRA